MRGYVPAHISEASLQSLQEVDGECTACVYVWLRVVSAGRFMSWKWFLDAVDSTVCTIRCLLLRWQQSTAYGMYYIRYAS
jgi:hypothetical protein